ncbi:MAG: transglycosylase domain-containing protein [Bacilli bacterium]
MKKFKKNIKVFIKNMKKIILQNKTNTLIIGISLLLLIIGIIANCFWLILALIIILNGLLIGIKTIYKNNKKLKPITPKNKEDIQIFDKIEDKKKEMKFMKKNIKNKKSKHHKTNKKTLGRKILLIILGIGIFLIGLFIIMMLFIIITAPPFNSKNLYHQESSILYDNNNEVFAKLGSEKREIITYDQLPEVLVDAIIATEDSRFFQHNGFDLPRFIKASLGQLLGNNAGGASTLTMQVVKNHFTSTESSGIKGIIRKFTDIYMAIFKVEKKYTKQEIIEFYVNSNYLGGSAYGVEQACINYFGKSAKDINLSEAAIIAGLFQAPGTYDPFINPDLTTERRNTVLYLMEKHDYITKEERKAAENIKIADMLTSDKAPTGNEYQGFIDTVAADIEEMTGYSPYSMAMEIHTTMNRQKQDYLNKIINGETFRWENNDVDTGIAVVDVNKGELAAVGTGRNNKAERSFNNATMANRQIGSTAKPLFDYGPAIEYKDWSTYNLLVDEPYTYSSGDKIQNWDGSYNGLMTAREALRKSRNIPALKAFQAVNNKDIIKFVKGLGLHPEIENGIIHEAHAIGGYTGESPLDVASAYAAFANGGYYVKPHSFTKIIYRSNDEVYEYKGVKKKVMGENTAYMIADMLVSTPSYALGGYANVNGLPYGAKTGTSNFSEETFKKYNLPYGAVNDLWVAGINPEYSITVWYGYEKINSNHVSKVGTAEHTRLFQAVAKGMFSSKTGFVKPSSVISSKVEMGTVPALLPSQYTPDSLIVTELFKAGTEPADTSKRYSQADKVTNLKATVKDDNVTLTWSPAGGGNDSNGLSNIFNNQSYYNSYINSHGALGNLVYNVYIKTPTGLTLLATTSDASFNHKPGDSGTYNYVVKAMYANSRKSESVGVETSAKIAVAVKELIVTLNGKDPEELIVGDNYKDQGITVLYDGIDVTSKANIIPSDNVDKDVAGSYTYNYTVTYKGLTKKITRQINYTNPIIP